MGGKLDFSGMFLVLGTIPEGTAMTLDALKKAQVPVFAYGSFLTILVNFIILAFIIFVMIKQMNRLKRSEPPAAAHLPSRRRSAVAARDSRQPEEVVRLRAARRGQSRARRTADSPAVTLASLPAAHRAVAVIAICVSLAGVAGDDQGQLLGVDVLAESGVDLPG
jgi:large-conductance mechanosensitive channel